MQACFNNSVSIPFTSYGIKTALSERPGVRKGSEGQLVLIDGQYSTPLYILKNPYIVTTKKDSFYIQYTSDIESILEINLDNKNQKVINLPSSKDLISYQVPVNHGEIINSFRISSTSNKTNSNFLMISSGIEESIYGLSTLSIDGTVIKDGFKKLDSNTYLFKVLSLEAYKQFNQVKISLGYTYKKEEIVEDSEEIELVLFSDDHEKSFAINLRDGSHDIYFYSNSLGFIPTGIKNKNHDSNFIITKIAISSFSTIPSRDYIPVAADIGTMLRYSQSAWRRSNFEIFSWNLFPNILVIDFKDYATQSLSLKRIAFFVEKDGFEGKLLNDDTLSMLHGWNAHDYRSEDLAAFFNKVDDTNLNLNPEEYEILNILIRNKIIMKTSNGYEPLSGGILSYSKESSPRLRRLFITHEGYHGIVFSDLEFATEIQAIWDSLDDLEKQFWYDFLSWKHYDIENPYLVVNEFMAYLMQQVIENIEPYYKDYIIPKYLIAFPDKVARMNEFLRRYPNHFLVNAKKLEEVAFRLHTIRSGELRCIY